MQCLTKLTTKKKFEFRRTCCSGPSANQTPNISLFHPYDTSVLQFAKNLTTAVRSDSSSLHLLELALELLDSSVCAFQILVEAISLGNELLLPLSETVLLDLDLLGESLAETLFLLLELWVVKLSWSCFSELSGLHLLGTIGLVVCFLGGVNEVEHVGTDENRTKLLEVTVILVFNFGYTPCVLATLNDTTISGLNILLGTDNSEWHSSHEAAGVLSSGLIVLLNRWGVDLDALRLDDCLDLTID